VYLSQYSCIDFAQLIVEPPSLENSSKFGLPELIDALSVNSMVKCTSCRSDLGVLIHSLFDYHHKISDQEQDLLNSDIIVFGQNTYKHQQFNNIEIMHNSELEDK